MLDQFQQAFADLIASPELVSETREDPGLLRGRYDLSDREWRRLISVVNQPGMKCNCMLYRANRLTPVAVYLPKLCEVLGADLHPLLAEYWGAYPHTNLNFLLESYRFCQFVQEKIDADSISGDIGPVLKEETVRISRQIREIFCAETNGNDSPDPKDISAVFAGAGLKIDLDAFLEISR